MRRALGVLLPSLFNVSRANGAPMGEDFLDDVGRGDDRDDARVSTTLMTLRNVTKKRISQQV